jgi:2-dehydropantoate 2-reductase
LILNAGLNPVSAIARATYGEAVAIPEGRELIKQLVNECVAVARAGGVGLPPNDYEETVWRFAESVSHVYSSTAQDLERGKPTEIDALNGLVVRRGAELGVPTPVNQSIVAMVKLLEARSSPISVP